MRARAFFQRSSTLQSVHGLSCILIRVTPREESIERSCRQRARQLRFDVLSRKFCLSERSHSFIRAQYGAKILLDCNDASTFMEPPKIRFSRWFRWKERNRIENSDKPGVYMLSKFGTMPSARADSLDVNVIYFGETCSQSLKERWNQFNRSAFYAKRGHSGGRSYRKVYGDKGLDLYVAAMPVDVANEDLRFAFIRFAERKLILDFVLRWRKLPKCNRK